MTDEHKKSCAAAIASLVRRMINDDETDLEQVPGAVLYDPNEDEFEYDPQAMYDHPRQIDDADGILAYLDGGGDDAIKWAIASPEKVGSDFVDCYACNISKKIERIRDEYNA
jgi:hypothetical protein